MRPGHAERQALGGVDDAHALEALAPDGLTGEQVVELVEAFGQRVE